MTGDSQRPPANAGPPRDAFPAGRRLALAGRVFMSLACRGRRHVSRAVAAVVATIVAVGLSAAPLAPAGASGITATAGVAPLAPSVSPASGVGLPTPDLNVTVAATSNLSSLGAPTDIATPGGATSPGGLPTEVMSATPAVTPSIPPSASPFVTASAAVSATASAGISQTATASPTATSSNTATATATGTGTATVTRTGTATHTATVTRTGTATHTATATATATSTRVASGLAAWRARGLIRARDFDAAPSVDLDLVPVTSTVLGPGQVAAYDLVVRAGPNEVVVIDAHLDVDPTLQVVSVDRPEGGAHPLPLVLSETWDNVAGTVHLAYGTIVGETEAGATGYFRLARLGVCAAPGTMASLKVPTTARIAFATNGDPNRQTAIYGRTSSLLRAATPLAISLNPSAGAIPAIATPDVTKLFQGIAGQVAFTVLDGANKGLASATFAATLDPPAAGDVVVASGTTGADGVATVRVRPSVSTGTGVVDLTVTSASLPGGSVRLSRLVNFGAPLPVEVTIVLPEAGGRVGGWRVPVKATTKAGPGAIAGTTVQVDWSWSKNGTDFSPIVGTATITATGDLLDGMAEGTWDTSSASSVPLGTMADGVALRATARAMFEGAVVGQGEAIATGITVDNLAPTIGSPKLDDVDLVDDVTTKHWFRTRAPILTGEAEVDVTIRVWRMDRETGAREATPFASCVVPCGVSEELSLRTVPGSVGLRAFGRFALPVVFGPDDEVASGLFLQIDAIDQKGINVGPAVIEVVDGTPTVLLQPIDVWVGIDTASPRVARVVVPDTVALQSDPPSTVLVEFTEPVRLPAGATTEAWAASDFVRLAHRVSNNPVPVDATLSVTCAPPAAVPAAPVAPIATSTFSSRALGTVAARDVCADGIGAATFTLASRPYPGGTYIVTVTSGVLDRAGNALQANPTADGGTVEPALAANPFTWKGPGTAPVPVLDIVGLKNGAVLHGTSTTPVILASRATNVDSQVTWRICVDENCAGSGDPLATLGRVAATATFQWNTMATDGSGARLYPDRRDVTLVVEGENTHLAGAEGKARAVQRVTLRSVAPSLAVDAVKARTCPVGADNDATGAASTTFNIARGDCDSGIDGLQVDLTATIPDSVGGVVDLVVQVDGGTPTALATGVPFGADGVWSVPVTLPQGTLTIIARAKDVAYPVANIADDVIVPLVVDTVAPVTLVSYPPDAARLAAPGGTLGVPILGVTESGSAVTITLTRDGTVVDGFPSTVTAAVANGQAAYRFPADGSTPLEPGLYRLTVETIDTHANPGASVTRTFRITPPPVAATLDPLGEFGASLDADVDLAGIQVVVRGSLPEGTTADRVPDGMIARLRRDGADAIGDGNRPVVAPVTLANGVWGFTFPPVTFTTDATAALSVVTVDDVGNRSAESATVTLTIDTTAPSLRIAAPVAGTAVGTTTPELAAVVGPRADGTFDTASATFSIRPSVGATFGPPAAWEIVRTLAIDPSTLAQAVGGAGVIRIDPSAWITPLPEPVAPDRSRTFDLRIEVADRLGNSRVGESTFVLQPGAPSALVTADDVRVIGTLDVTTEAIPTLGTTVAAIGSGVSIRSVEATIRQRGASSATPLTVNGVEARRTLFLGGVSTANGSVHDIVVTVTDSEGRTASTSVVLRIVRPRDLVVSVKRGAVPVQGATVRVVRDAADLPAVSLIAETAADGAAPTFSGVSGGPVLIAVDGVPGYPVTSVVAQVTEPRARASLPWAFTLDLDALNPNEVSVTMRGLGSTILGYDPVALAGAIRIDTSVVAGARLPDVAVGEATSGLNWTFGNDVSRISRAITAPTLEVNGAVVSASMRLPFGAASWRIAPVFSAAASSLVVPKGASDATAVFTASASTDVLPVAFRYVPTNLLVKSLTGTVRRPDGSPVAGATIVVTRGGGVSVSAVSSVDGLFGPVLLEAGDYVVAPVAAPGADWIPDRAARVSFAGDDAAGDRESASVAIAVEPAGGTLQGRLTRAVTGGAAELTTGTVVLQGDGRAITARAGASVLPGADATTGANFSAHAPAGTYLVSVVPDDPSRTPPSPQLVRLADGRVTELGPAALPALERTLAHVDGVVRLSTGQTIGGIVVQAHLDGGGVVVAATTDDTGRYHLSMEPGTWSIGATSSRGATLLPGNLVVTTVAALASVTVGDIVVPAATSTIERTFVKALADGTTVSLTDAEAAEIAGTAFLKDEVSGLGTSIAFQGSRLRLAIPAGRYRLGIALHSGDFLPPESETGIVAGVGAPSVATRTVVALATQVVGRLVTGQTANADGTGVPLRAVIRATGIAGATTGVVFVTESRTDGTFALRLAPGTWRIAAAPEAADGFVANVDRPWVDVTISAGGTATPSTVALDLRPATRVVQGTVTVATDSSGVPLAGVRVVADVTGASGGIVSVTAETGRDGRFTLRLPAGAATIQVSAANARYGVGGAGYAAGDPAWVVDPIPVGVPASGDAPVAFQLAGARATVSGTTSANGLPVSGATISATLISTSQARVATSLGGSLAGQWSLRLSPGTWRIGATADLALANGNRVPASAIDSIIDVAQSDLSGNSINLIPSAVVLPPAVSGAADPSTGGLVRAGRSSAEVRIAPGAVSEPLTVTVEPLGSAPSLTGFVPFGDAFRITAVTATGVPVSNLAVDSTLLITYSSVDLAAKKAPSRAAHQNAAAQASDLQPARYDPVTGGYTVILGGIASAIDSVTGLFTAPIRTLGTFVLTSREALAALPTPPPPPPGGGGGSSGGGVSTARPVAVPTPVPVLPTPEPIAPTPLVVPELVVTPVATAAPRIPAAFLPTDRPSVVSVVVTPVDTDTRPDGRTDARAVAPPGGAPVVVPVGAMQVVTVDLPSDGAVIAFLAPNFAGINGGSIVVRVSSALLAQIRAIAPNAIARLQFDPYPSTASDAQRGFIGGGIVAPIGTPIDLRLDVRDPLGVQVDLGALRQFGYGGTSSAPGVEVAVPVPARLVGTEAVYACLVGLYEPGVSGAFLGYGRVPAPYDPASVTNILTIDVDGLQGTLLLPAELRVAYVSNFDPDAHLWSNPTASAIDLGPIGGPVTPMRVVGPQVGTRIFVSNPRTGGVGWVDAAVVGPEDPAKAGLPLLPPAEATLALPKAVKTNSGTAHVYAHEGPTAIDFGLVGPMGTTLMVIGPALEGRVFVFNPVTGNYGWVNLAEVVTLDGTPVGQAVPVVPVPVATPDATVTLPKAVKANSGTAHVYAHEGPTAIDFGLVGPMGTTLTVIGPALEGRVFVFNPVTENYGWVNLAEVVTLDGAPVGQAVPVVPVPVATPDAAVTLPKAVKTNSGTAHVYAHEGPTAIDFGLVGPMGTTLTVIGPALEGRVYVFNPVTENYGWVNLAEVVTLDGAPVGGNPVPSVATIDPAVAPTSAPPITGEVVTQRDGVRLWSNATATAVDFGAVGPKGSNLTLLGPREGPRAFVLNPITQNVAWVDIEAISVPGR
jgi:hypothetical protein